MNSPVGEAMYAHEFARLVGAPQVLPTTVRASEVRAAIAMQHVVNRQFLARGEQIRNAMLRKITDHVLYGAPLALGAHSTIYRGGQS